MDDFETIADRYTLRREIGRGGSGVVHLAQDEVLGRTVAIKRIGLMPGSEQVDLARAEREARIAAALNHPNVVAVFDLVEHAGAHWLVMEYVPGTTLSELARSASGLETREAARIVGQAAAALSDAHRSGIVHRDVKPSNILVNDDGEAKLADFGIARAHADPSLTQTGLVTGSPAYLAPEVASGGSATEASDVWSLGATLFHTLTGRPPYDVGENLVGALYKIVHEDPPRLPEAGPLAGLLASTMVKDPTQRWPMERVRDELQSVAAGGAGTRAPAVPAASPTADASTTDVMQAVPAPQDIAPPPPGAVPEPRSSRRGGALLAVAGIAVVALLAVLVVWLWPGDGSRPVAQEPGPSSTSSPTSTSPATQDEAAQTEQQAMTEFVTSYLSTVTSDPRAAFQQLTPEFRRESGGYEGYIGWWGTVQSASPRDVVADPEAMTVGYTVDYVMKDGEQTTEQVRLQLERRGDQILIAGEA